MKRATFLKVISSKFKCISIHALVKRATSANDLFVWAIKDFNPRPREEGDGSKKDISKPKLYFNPRPREEGDITQTSIQLSVDLFQSTPS